MAWPETCFVLSVVGDDTLLLSNRSTSVFVSSTSERTSRLEGLFEAVTCMAHHVSALWQND